MKTAQEMVSILADRLEANYKAHKRYIKKYEETGKDSWYEIASEKMEVVITLEHLYKDFTGKEYEFEEEE